MAAHLTPATRSSAAWQWIATTR